MKKRLATILSLIMCFALITTSVSFASDIDKGALDVFLNELSKVDDETRKAAVDILEIYLSNEKNGIEYLKNDLDIFLNESHIKKIESKGYTLDDVKDQLDNLNDWDMKD